MQHFRFKPLFLHFSFLCSLTKVLRGLQEIPADFTDKPELLSESGSETDEVSENNYQWFYEGRNGWWQYDERTSAELEAASAKQEPR